MLNDEGDDDDGEWWWSRSVTQVANSNWITRGEAPKSTRRGGYSVLLPGWLAGSMRYAIKLPRYSRLCRKLEHILRIQLFCFDCTFLFYILFLFLLLAWWSDLMRDLSRLNSCGKWCCTHIDSLISCFTNMFVPSTVNITIFIIIVMSDRCPLRMPPELGIPYLGVSDQSVQNARWQIPQGRRRRRRRRRRRGTLCSWLVVLLCRVHMMCYKNCYYYPNLI